MRFYDEEKQVYIDPKEECIPYLKKLNRKNLAPLPTKLIYTPISLPEVTERLEKKIKFELPAIYPNTNFFWLNGDILFYRGLPGASMTGVFIEELIALGINKIVFLGLAGGIQNVMIGDRIIVTESLRFEGTSFHYLPYENPCFSSKIQSDQMYNFFKKEGLKCKTGKICTTDAPFRETYTLIEKLRKDEVIGIEMEISAVLAIAYYRSVAATALVIISDELKDNSWSHFKPDIYLDVFLSSIDDIINFLKSF